MSVLVLERPTAPVENIQARIAEQVEDHQGTVDLILPLADSACKAVYDPYNERIKLYGPNPLELADLAGPTCEEPVASKVTAYAPPGDAGAWESLGFRREGVIRGYFDNGADAHLWAAYTEPSREEDPRRLEHDQAVGLAMAKPRLVSPALPEGYHCEEASPEHSRDIASLMQQTFADYPSPIEEEIIAEQIKAHTNRFRMVRDPEGELAAVASAELDHNCLSAEMTDCATRIDQRGRGLMAYILAALEKDCSRVYGITDLYTLARADEVGMNCVFSKLGYGYSGRLVNNCRMPNGWESMNVWCKDTSAG